MWLNDGYVGNNDAVGVSGMMGIDPRRLRGRTRVCCRVVSVVDSPDPSVSFSFLAGLVGSNVRTIRSAEVGVTVNRLSRVL